MAIGSALVALVLSAAVPAATVINFQNFTSCTGLQVNGNSACTGGMLRLTPSLGGQSGSAFSTTTVPLGPGATFSTFFVFQMTSPGGAGDSDGAGADGLTFTVQPVSSSVGGGGGGMGYAGIPTSLAVEFDTFFNGGTESQYNLEERALVPSPKVATCTLRFSKYRRFAA